MEGVLGVVWLIIIFLGIFSNKNKKNSKNNNQRNINQRNYNQRNRAKTTTEKNLQQLRNSYTVSSDGHTVPRGQDLTCERKYGHKHGLEYSMGNDRYVVHEEPTQGYIVLNGKKYSKDQLRGV
jgi:hypothetical protein